MNAMLERMLIASAAQMGISLSDAQAEQFARYHGMLVEANAKFNLTRVPDDLREAADRNYLDCIAPVAAGALEGVQTLIDVGSGAGFPGIPLSILMPDTHVVLLDALDKRVKFLQSVADALHLNAEAVHLRCEDAARSPALRERFDCAVARAVAPMNVLAEYLLPFVRVGGRMLALKGPSLETEMTEAQYAISALGGRADGVIPVEIPGRDWRHSLAKVAKIAPTPEKYPRKAGTPEKKPLVVAKLC